MTVTASLEDIVHAGDITALEAYIEHSMQTIPYLSQADISSLWEACWAVWEACDPIEHLGLGA